MVDDGILDGDFVVIEKRGHGQLNKRELAKL